jgi:geranylgeranyl diphosphate synthase, type II
MSSRRTAYRRPQIRRDTRHLITRLHQRVLRAVMLTLPSDEPRKYLYDLMPVYPHRTGKGLRPVLCMAACAAYGGSYEEALPFAAALELLHNAFLVHDDIQDASTVRRGRPSLHVDHGTPLALNAGDALAASATAAFVRATGGVPPHVAAALLEGWEHMTRETLEGQALDLGWQRDNVLDLTVADYIDMCGKKTAWYTTIQPLAIGATLGSGRPALARETFQFGWHLGLLFQIANDLDGVRPGADKSDVEEGKRTILLLDLLDVVDGANREKVIRIMSQPRHKRKAGDVEWVHKQMEKAGTIDYVRSCVSDLAEATMREAEHAFGDLPDTPARDLLLSITPYVVESVGW